MIKDLDSFFKEIQSDKGNDLDFDRIAYIATSEWHWSDEQLMNCSIPYLFIMLEQRAKDIKRQEDEYKQRRRK